MGGALPQTEKETMTTMNIKRAGAAGYHALTTSYRLPGERALLDSVLADMRRGNISHVLVRERRGVAVWRRGWREAEGLRPEAGEGNNNRIMGTKSWAGGGRTNQSRERKTEMRKPNQSRLTSAATGRKERKR